MSEQKQPSLLGHEKALKELREGLSVLTPYVIASLRTQARSREAQIIANELEELYAEGTT